MLSTLIGVLVGGTISLVTQLLVDRTKDRRLAKQDTADRRALGRILEDYFWVAGNVLQETLTTGRWWSPDRDPIWRPQSHDYARLIREIGDDSIGVILAADRRFQELIVLRESLKWNETKISEDQGRRFAGTLLLCDHCRLTLADLRGRLATPLDLSTIIVDSETLSFLSDKLLPEGSPVVRDGFKGGAGYWH